MYENSDGRRKDIGADFDAIIIGAGPAGLSAAIYLGRYLRPTLIINDREPRTRWHRPTGHNVLGFPAGIMRSQLLEWGLAHVGQYESVKFHHGRVERIAQKDGRFTLTDDGGAEFNAAGLILAMGMEYLLPELPHVYDYAGHSIYHCPECDGYKMRGKRVIVLGHSRGVAAMALALRIWTDKITICTHGQKGEFDAPCAAKLREQHIDIYEEPVTDLLGDHQCGVLGAVQLKGGRRIECAGIFVNLGSEPPTDLLCQLPLRLHKGQYVHVDYRQRTSLPRCYAAGDIVAFAQTQLSVAVGQGATAGIWLHKELLPDCYRLDEQNDPAKDEIQAEHHGHLIPRPQPAVREAQPSPPRNKTAPNAAPG